MMQQRGRGRPKLTERTKARRAQLAERIRAERELSGLSQQQLADFVGVAKAILQKWEKGEAPVPAEALPDLAIALGCTATRLLGEHLIVVHSNATAAA